MSTLKNIPIDFSTVVEKLNNFSNTKGLTMVSETKDGFVELKFYSSMSPGLLRIYNTKKGLTIDGSTGKNPKLNNKLIEFINEIIAIKKSDEQRLTFRHVLKDDFEEIIKKISLFSDGERSYQIEDKAVTNNLEEKHLMIRDTKTKEELNLKYYTNGTLYLYGFMWNLGEEIANIVYKALGRQSQMQVNYINEIIHVCNENYITFNEEECIKCDNPCNGNCSRYLQEIHYGEKKRYSCGKVMNYYMPKYAYRYAFEIEQLLKLQIEEIRNFDSLNILSIGCGPCTELLGITNLDSLIKKPIKYSGIDLNEKWEKVHLILKDKLAKEVTLKYYYKDIFDFLNEINPMKRRLQSNILIFQYVISDIIKYKSTKEVCSFMQDLFDELVEYLPKNAIIVFNDINHKEKARDAFDYFVSLLPENKYIIHKYYFRRKTEEEYFIYGEEIKENQVPYLIPDYIENKYNPWCICKSAALVIGKVE